LDPFIKEEDQIETNVKAMNYFQKLNTMTNSPKLKMKVKFDQELREMLDSESEESFYELKIDRDGSPDKDLYIFKKNRDDVLVKSLSEIRNTLEGSFGASLKNKEANNEYSEDFQVKKKMTEA
jgi:hypothetical protein